MNKIVYNACYGGFGLSEAAMIRYAELKGVKLYVERGGITTYYWTHPEASSKEWGKYAEYYYRPDFERHDSDLVKVVEEFGSEKASSRYSNLHIYETESPMYRIEEYDGSESVITPDNQDWISIE